MYQYSQLDATKDEEKKVQVTQGNTTMTVHADIDSKALQNVMDAVKARAGPAPPEGPCDCSAPVQEAREAAATAITKANVANTEALNEFKAKHNEALDQIKSAAAKADAEEKKAVAAKKAHAEA